MKYVKKPIPIEAHQFRVNGQATSWPGWLQNALYLRAEPKSDGQSLWYDGEKWMCGTLEGPHVVTDGDYIIQGVRGEIYPCKPDIFEETYEAVE